MQVTCSSIQLTLGEIQQHPGGENPNTSIQMKAGTCSSESPAPMSADQSQWGITPDRRPTTIPGFQSQTQLNKSSSITQLFFEPVKKNFTLPATADRFLVKGSILSFFSRPNFRYLFYEWPHGSWCQQPDFTCTNSYC